MTREHIGIEKKMSGKILDEEVPRVTHSVFATLEESRYLKFGNYFRKYSRY